MAALVLNVSNRISSCVCLLLFLARFITEEKFNSLMLKKSSVVTRALSGRVYLKK